MLCELQRFWSLRLLVCVPIFGASGNMPYLHVTLSLPARPAKIGVVQVTCVAYPAPGLLSFLTFCRLLMEDQPPWGILENVIGFDTNLLIDLIGSVYSVYTLIVSPQDHGFNLVRRDRLYMVLVHRRKASFRHDLHAMYGFVSDALSRTLHTVVADCVLAKDTEVIADTAALAQRRKRLHKLGNKNQELHLTSDEESRKRKLSAVWVELILS